VFSPYRKKGIDLLESAQNNFTQGLNVFNFQINCLIALFCVALSTGWTSRVAGVIGLIFTLVSLLFIGGAIATLFVWNLADMSLLKVVKGALSFSTLSRGAFNCRILYGCFQTYYSGASGELTFGLLAFDNYLLDEKLSTAY
ncbi:unnamed protein product, partial [Heligmosomoides polygyrus]|uniref:Aa_trans domain-containing protein n=1 Tax=Heligmosomoides polygyrus TaxID=6339 RepID=A0A183FXT5_HELPZ